MQPWLLNTSSQVQSMTKNKAKQRQQAGIPRSLMINAAAGWIIQPQLFTIAECKKLFYVPKEPEFISNYAVHYMGFLVRHDKLQIVFGILVFLLVFSSQI
jgi:hypothetical protein